MPAARPSQASVNNAVAALVEACLTPTALQVAPDGSFRVELLENATVQELAAVANVGNDGEPPSWDELK
jgi:hypothetical protein